MFNIRIRSIDDVLQRRASSWVAGWAPGAGDSGSIRDAAFGSTVVLPMGDTTRVRVQRPAQVPAEKKPAEPDFPG